MDCHIARMMLAFARPAEGERDSGDVADLERHLAGCPECDELSRSERLLDQHLGQAMRRVEVPDRMRGVLLARLDQERSAWYRKRTRQFLSMAAGIAALVLIVWGIVLWRYHQLPAVDLQGALYQVNFEGENPELRENIEDYFRNQGYHVSIPNDLNLEFHTSWGLGFFQGRLVPQLILSRPGTDPARVYLLSNKQFNLSSLKESLPDDTGYHFKVKCRYNEGDRQACVIFYTGELNQWLKPQETPDRAVF